jgi:arylsulfatase A-like enzyme
MKSTLVLITALLTTLLALPAAAASRPNIIYILADDLGWADVGWHRGEIKTPHLDKLAEGGAKLEQFYVLPVCTPTRAALVDDAAKRRVELFNLAEDPQEKHDLSAKHLEKVKQLRERLEAYRAAAVPPKAEGEPANYKAPRVWGQ